MHPLAILALFGIGFFFLGGVLNALGILSENIAKTQLDDHNKSPDDSHSLHSSRRLELSGGRYKIYGSTIAFLGIIAVLTAAGLAVIG